MISVKSITCTQVLGSGAVALSQRTEDETELSYWRSPVSDTLQLKRRQLCFNRGGSLAHPDSGWQRQAGIRALLEMRHLMGSLLEMESLLRTSRADIAQPAQPGSLAFTGPLDVEQGTTSRNKVQRREFSGALHPRLADSSEHRDLGAGIAVC